MMAVCKHVPMAKIINSLTYKCQNVSAFFPSILCNHFILLSITCELEHTVAVIGDGADAAPSQPTHNQARQSVQTACFRSVGESLRTFRKTN